MTAIAEPKTEPVVALRGAGKTYGPITALHGVDLELRAGEVMCLAGENGAGKSTLIKILTGAIRRDEGEYLVDGSDVGNPSPAQAREAGIGVVYQELSLLPDLSVGENLLMGRLPSRRWVTRPRELRKQARTMLERVGLEHLDPDTQVGTLSLATQQLVEIAKVLGENPRVLIFDEPTTALSEAETKALLARIHQLRDEGHAVMYVTHHLEEMFEIGDRVTILRDGGLVTAAPMSRLHPRQPDRVDGGAEDRVAVPGVEPHDRRGEAGGPGPATAGLGARRSTSSCGRGRSSASPGCSGRAAASCCARSSAPTRSKAATSRSTGARSPPAIRAPPCGPGWGC